MPAVLVLVCPVGAPPDLLDDALETGASALGVDPTAADILAPARAAELSVGIDDVDAGLTAVRTALADRPVDPFLVPADNRRKQLLLADMDSTMVTEETLDEMAVEAGLADQVIPVTRRAMNGELDFAEALRERLALFADQPADLIDRVRARTEMSAGGRTLVRTMRRHGAFCQLVSGGFDCFTKWVADELGFHAEASNRLVIDGDRLAGRVEEPILDRNSKLDLLNELVARLGIPSEAVAAVGDGANDLPMLNAASLGVAYHAKPTVRAACSARIDHTDLEAILYVQGYRHEDFVTG